MSISVSRFCTQLLKYSRLCTTVRSVTYCSVVLVVEPHEKLDTHILMLSGNPPLLPVHMDNIKENKATNINTKKYFKREKIKPNP